MQHEKLEVSQIQYTTADEIHFLNLMGLFSSAKHRASRRTLLRRYRDAMPLRSRWGRLDRDRISRHVEALIARDADGADVILREQS
jgi:hypothetical protein